MNIATPTDLPDSVLRSQRDTVLLAGELQATHAHLQPDDFVGHYRIVRKIGQGGMGAVYLAERADGEFQQLVALKTLSPNFAHHPNLMTRMLAERQILAKLQHPNIAALLDGGTDSRGHPFLVMEYVDGLSIDQYCELKKLDVRQRVELYLQVCDATARAHEALIVHRDLKPDNVLVSARGVPKLLDFGIAKILSDDPAFAGHGHTETGLSPMTQRYASPEQVRGDTLTTASDIYSLAVVLYELLVGRLPYLDEHLQGLQIVSAIMEHDPPLPSRRADSQGLGTVAQALRGDLDAILLKALRKQPEDRYRNVEQFSDDLRRYLRRETVAARAGNDWYQLRRFARRHWLWVAALAGLGAFLVQTALSLKQQRDAAQRERDSAAQTTAFLSDLFLRVDPNQSPNPNLSARELIDTGRERLMSSFKAQPEVQLGLMLTLAEVYLRLGEAQLAKPMLKSVVENQQQLSAALQERLSLALGQQRLAEEDLPGVLQSARDFQPLTPSGSRERWRLMFLAQSRLGQTAASVTSFQQYAQSFPEPSAVEQTELVLARAHLSQQNQDGQACARQLAQSDTVFARALPSHRLQRLLLWSRCLSDQTRASEALQISQQALDEAVRFTGKQSPEFADALIVRAAPLFQSGDYLRAETTIAQAAQIILQRRGPLHASMVDVHRTVAQIASKTGRLPLALKAWQDATRAAEGQKQIDSALIASLYQSQANLHMQLGQPAAAAAALEQAVAAARKRAPETLTKLQLSLAQLYCQVLKQTDQGAAHLRDATLHLPPTHQESPEPVDQKLCVR